MIVALPCCESDLFLLKLNLEWMEMIGGCRTHEAVLIVEEGVNWDDALELKRASEKVFKKVAMRAPTEGWRGWPAGPNSMFLAAARYANLVGQPFLFCEPDCVPLRTRWLDALEEEYRTSRKPFMGALVKCSQPGLPEVSLAGNAIYPAEALGVMEERIQKKPGVAFDVSTADLTVPKSHATALIHHFWGQKDLPPIFSRTKHAGSAVNTLTLENIQKGAALFHRCKDGSLIRLLRSLMFPDVSDRRLGELEFVFPFCSKDEILAQKTMRWIADFCGQINRTAVLHYDNSVNRHVLDFIRADCRRAFRGVVESRYPAPRFPFLGWPGACNWSFRKSCEFMEQREGPWMWFEADAVAVKPDWVFQLESEYQKGGKPFMGTVIGDFDNLKMGHINGTAIYPWNAAAYFPRALANPAYPWDAGMRDEMIQYAHRGNRIMQHCGAVVNGCCKPANGPQAKFPTQREVDSLVDPETVFFHPCKDGSLIDRLRERYSNEHIHSHRHTPEGLSLAGVVS